MGPPPKSATDIVKCQEMADIIEKLTTSGRPELEKDLTKKLKSICKQSDDYVKHAHYLIMIQLEKDHSEIRLSAMQLVDELFCRSHCFRELILADFQYLMELTLEIDHELPLPPPKPAAKLLKTKTISCIQQWQEKYGEAYKKLSLGYHFLKNCKKINFESIRAETQAELQREEERRQRQEAQQKERLKKAITELEETSADIKTCLLQADNCLKLLFPDLHTFNIHEPYSPEPQDSKQPLTSPIKSRETQEIDKESARKRQETNSSEDGEKSNSELLSKVQNVEHIHENSNNAEKSIKETNELHIQNKTDQDILLKTEPLKKEPEPSTSGTASSQQTTDSAEDSDSDFEEISDLEEFSLSSGDEEPMQADTHHREHGFGSHKFSLQIELPQIGFDHIQETLDNTDILSTLKDTVSLITNEFLPTINKCLEAFSKNGGEPKHVKQALDTKADLVAMKTKITKLKVSSMPQNTSDDVKHEVDEDEDDFEEVPEKEGYEADVPEHLKEAKKPARPITSREWTLPKEAAVGTSNEDEKDPTTWFSTMRKLRESMKADSIAVPSTSKGASIVASSSSSLNPMKEELLKKAPVVPFGLDLYHWGEELKETPSLPRNEYDSHRFWRPVEEEVQVDKEALAQMKSRVINFTGQFEPVKWKCRAPLHNGKLCERMDRKKCPFHGLIIARNELGEPTRPEDIEHLAKLKEQKDKDKVQDWDDPELHQDIMAATGIDLSRKGKGQGRGKGKSKKKKYPNLTDIRKINNTNRNRLKSKVLNRSSLKRVAAAMDNLDHKRYRDKFGNQFNYAYSVNP